MARASTVWSAGWAGSAAWREGPHTRPPSPLGGEGVGGEGRGGGAGSGLGGGCGRSRRSEGCCAVARMSRRLRRRSGTSPIDAARRCPPRSRAGLRVAMPWAHGAHRYERRARNRPQVRFRGSSIPMVPSHIRGVEGRDPYSSPLSPRGRGVGGEGVGGEGRGGGAGSGLSAGCGRSRRSEGCCAVARMSRRAASSVRDLAYRRCASMPSALSGRLGPSIPLVRSHIRGADVAAGHGNRTHRATPSDAPRPVLKTGAGTSTTTPAVDGV